ncbi:MAG: hypothetical protein KDC24_14565, partial [Saprospiraceae bacterium]|nr:hypothetical protein [Saprospiraceae bacterium]
SYSIYSLGINTSQTKAVSGEAKIFANRDFDDLLLELDFFYNFKERKYHRFSVGAGINSFVFDNLDPFYSIVIPTQLEVFPLKDFRQLSLMLEFAPQILIDDDLVFRHLWGIRYTFAKKGE